MSKKVDYNLKIIVCGEGAVGKTSIVRRFIENKFEHRYLLTVGMEPSNKIIEVKGPNGEKIKINLLIYDVAGQKRFQLMREIFFRGANGAILVFDITRPIDTIEGLLEWNEQVKERAGDIPKVLVGNKIDVKEEFDFMTEDIADLIPKFECDHYIETSAAKGEQIEDIFEKLTKDILLRQNKE